MALACGCEFRGGMPIHFEMAKEHYKHTLEALFYWELARRTFVDHDVDIRLSMARIAYVEALEAKVPELKEP